MNPFTKNRPKTAVKIVNRKDIESDNKRPKTVLKKNQENTTVKKIRRSPYFLYLIKNKKNLIDNLKNKSIEYEKIQKKSVFLKKYEVETDIPVPGDSFTDRIHKLLYYEQKTNFDLIAFQELSEKDIQAIKSDQIVKISIDFGNNNIQDVVFDKKKYQQIEFIDKFIEAVYKDLASNFYDTNSKLISDFNENLGEMKEFNEINSYPEYLLNLLDNILSLSNQKRFESDQNRFLNLERTDDNHNKKYKIKHDDGFMYVADGYKFGGLSEPIPVIKRILSSGEHLNKYQNTWIQKKDKMSPTTEIYKAKILELLGVSKSKIRLQSKNWNVEYIKMNENAHILNDAIKDKDFFINKKLLDNECLI
jgi:hypothetical protein